MDSENDLQQYVKRILADNPYKLVLSGADGLRETMRRLENGYQSERIVNRQAFQTNLTVEETYPYILSRFEDGYRQLNAWSESYEYNLRVAKRGRAMFSRKANKNAAAPSEQHNRVKNYILPEGEIVPPLVDMGIFTPDGKVVPSRYDKYKQINRFLEMMDDTLGGLGEGETLHVVDFGCGKSYLTFILYHYLYKVKGIHAVVTGVDLKADIIADCNRAAKKYGYDGLSFVTGNIAAFQPDDVVDVVVSLHACDTATDYALYNAVAWNAKHIFSVPCCQHELNKQMTGGRFPILTRYGIIQERFAAMATDAIRANLLTAVGYKTQMLEFVDLSHTPKNLLLRGSKCDLPEEHRQTAFAEAKALMGEFGFEPTLFRLLADRLS